MSTYADAGHRPHAVHTGEVPQTPMTLGPYGLTVTLDAWGPKEFAFPMADALQANWGDEPSRLDPTSQGDTARAYTWAQQAFEGRTLPQVLEGLTFWFTINGCSRATTHQLVRTRMGAAFMQHGGRDNDWRHRRFTIPETVRRLVVWADHPLLALKDLGRWLLPRWVSNDDGEQLQPPVHNPEEAAVILERYVADHGYATLAEAIEDTLRRNKALYAALVDAGVPWQDARRFLPMGTQTYIHAIYNYTALTGVLSKRLEHVMDWEINCVAQLMLRELHMKCPPLVWQSLGSVSDKAGRAMFAHMESWPPDGKWPVPDSAAALPRTHRPEQNPFWVLHPDAMAGGPVEWIPTNGVYPQNSMEE